MPKYSFNRREITRVRKYVMHEGQYTADEAIVLLGMLSEVERQYQTHLTKLANERYREYKVNWQRDKKARDKLRLCETIQKLRK